MMTTILTIHVPSTPGRAWNMLVALQAGNIVARYAKLHLYDAFAIQESRHVDAGNEIAPLLEVEGMKVSLGRYQGLIPAFSIRNRESMTHVSYSF